jgi:hypothetical protein
MDLTVASQEGALLSQNSFNFTLLRHFGKAACYLCTFCDVMANSRDLCVWWLNENSKRGIFFHWSDVFTYAVILAINSWALPLS